MTAAITITAILAAALFIPLGRHLGRREQSELDPKPRTVADHLAEQNVIWIEQRRANRRSTKKGA